jgi:hypothetical protein
LAREDHHLPTVEIPYFKISLLSVVAEAELVVIQLVLDKMAAQVVVQAATVQRIT